MQQVEELASTHLHATVAPLSSISFTRLIISSQLRKQSTNASKSEVSPVRSYAPALYELPAGDQVTRGPHTEGGLSTLCSPTPHVPFAD